MSVVVAEQTAVRSAPDGVRRWAYLGEDPAWRIAAERGSLAGLERIPTRDALQQHAHALRQPYLDWIAELGVANDSLEWWASELAAKNVYTFLFQRLCAVAVATDVLADDVLLVCPTAAFAATVTQIATDRGIAPAAFEGGRRGSHATRDAAYRLYHEVPRRRPAKAAAAAGDVLLATWIDDRSFDAGGGYRDPHFGPLAAMLRERGHEVSLLARLLPTRSRRETLRRLAATGERVYLPDAYLTPGDWRDAGRRARGFTPAIADDATVGGVPAARMARELLAQSRMAHTGALTYEPLVRRLAAAGAQPAAIVVPWEGHAWETALFAAARRYLPSTALVAYDNVNFSSLALSLYPGAAELAVRPLPDRVVTNGETFARLLGERGFPRERVHVGCALRHGYLYQRQSNEGTPTIRQYVLAAGSIDATQTIEMVDVAHSAFGDDLLVKLHPASDAAHVRAATPSGVRFADDPIGELLRGARALIYTYSVVPYEALAAGVPPIFFQSQALLDLDQLEPTPEIRWAAATGPGLRAALEAAEQTASTPGWRTRARDAVVSALAPPDRCDVEVFAGEPGSPA